MPQASVVKPAAPCWRSCAGRNSPRGIRFALTVGLHNAGRFSWAEWTTALAIELRAAAVRGEPDDGSHYYEHWLSALEHLVTTKGLTEAASLDNRRKAWAQAYRATPHGRPVELG
jgi:nitrile hydratase accessory protein